VNNLNNSYKNIIKDINIILNQNSMTNKVKYIEEIYDKINGNKKKKMLIWKDLKILLIRSKNLKKKKKESVNLEKLFLKLE